MGMAWPRTQQRTVRNARRHRPPSARPLVRAGDCHVTSDVQPQGWSGLALLAERAGQHRRVPRWWQELQAIPQSVPGKLFWSVTVDDTATRSQVQTDQYKAALRSMFELKDVKATEPIDLYFGRSAPAGQEGRWIKTVPGKKRSVCIHSHLRTRGSRVRQKLETRRSCGAEVSAFHRSLMTALALGCVKTGGVENC